MVQNMIVTALEKSNYFKYSICTMSCLWWSTHGRCIVFVFGINSIVQYFEITGSPTTALFFLHGNHYTCTIILIVHDNILYIQL